MSGAMDRGDTLTTRARAWALERADGVTLGFTDHDRDLQFGGLVFRAGAGLSASALVQATGLSVDNTEAVGALSDAGLTEADIMAGRYDNAALTIFDVDWTAPDNRRILFRGTLGEITRVGGAFRAELRGLSEPLGLGGGRVFGALCPAVLGDAACGVDLTQSVFSHQTTITAIQDDAARLVLPLLGDFAQGWFAGGQVQVLSGPAKGLSATIRDDRVLAAARQLDLWAAPGIAPLPGDSIRVLAGCDKRFQTCRVKFANTENFQGFPHIPGDDWLMATPRVDGENDGGSIVQ